MVGKALGQMEAGDQDFGLCSADCVASVKTFDLSQHPCLHL